MTWEMIFISILLFLAIISFIAEKISTDITALSVLGILVLGTVVSRSEHLPSIEQYLSVFSNPAPITIAAMFIVSNALERCGLIESFASYLGQLSKIPFPLFFSVLLAAVAVFSAFMNNTAIVVILLPIVLGLARKIEKPASKVLIPISYASIFGGCCTAIGTSTNILLSGILVDHEMPPLSMFELASIGLPLAIAGTLYLVFFSNRLLPVRETLTAILTPEERKEYITEAFIRLGSPLIGKPFSDSDFFKNKGIRLIEIIRDGVSLESNLSNYILKEGDRLVLACRSSAIIEARNIKGVHFQDDVEAFLEPIAAHEGSIVEAIIGPTSGLIGESIKDVNFRQHFRMILLAIHRRGANLRDRLDSLQFEFGDTLLMMGTDSAIEHLRKSNDMILLDKSKMPVQNMRKKIPIVVLTLLGIVMSVTLGWAPIVGAAIIGVSILFLTGSLKPQEAYQAVEWRILVLIYGMLALGQAMEVSGLAHFIADHLVACADSLISAEMRPYAMLAVIYLCTAILTEALTNNATVVLMAPIAIGLAATLGVDPRPFAIATCIGSSASFSTPIGYQTNTYVYGVGGYKFSDFFKIGIPLNLLFFLTCSFAIPWIWKF